jgi:hypothetical protein
MSERHLLINLCNGKPFRCAPNENALLHQFFFSIQQTPKGKILITCRRRHFHLSVDIPMV